MLEPRVFTPVLVDKSQSSLISKIFAYLLGAVLVFGLFVRVRAVNGGLIFFGLIVLCVCIAALFIKNPISITVSVADKTLVYIYKTIWGQEKIVTVDLTNAGGTYKYELFSKTSAGWRLLLYNGNYFHNRISIEQRKGGFSKEQLDEIVSLIQECKALLV